MEVLAIDAFNYLLDVQSRANPTNISGNSDLSSISEFVHFRLDEFHLLIPIQLSSEVLLDCRYSQLPDVEPWLFGVSNNRGRLITLIDLECYFLKQEAGNLRRKRVIVVEYDNCFYGLIVSQVYGVMQSTSLQISDTKSSVENAQLDSVVETEFRFGPNKIYQLNLPVFFQQILGSLQ